MLRFFFVFLILPLSLGCLAKEKVQYGTYVNLPNIMYGINFSTIKLIDVISILQKNNIRFKSYDWDIKEIKWTGSSSDIERIGKIETNYFIGFGLDKSKIVNVTYRILPPYMAFQVCITMEEEYYDTILELLKKQFGYENADINSHGYGEITWYADPKIIKSTDLGSVLLTKRQGQYDSPEEAAKRGVFYLTIQTVGKDMETEYRKFVEKGKMKNNR